jgi:hypothetical protein
MRLCLRCRARSTIGSISRLGPIGKAVLPIRMKTVHRRRPILMPQYRGRRSLAAHSNSSS